MSSSSSPPPPPVPSSLLADWLTEIERLLNNPQDLELDRVPGRVIESLQAVTTEICKYSDTVLIVVEMVGMWTAI
jgi:hypothetical protein